MLLQKLPIWRNGDGVETGSSRTQTLEVALLEAFRVAREPSALRGR